MTYPRRPWLVFILLSLSMTACVEKTMDLREARDVALAYQGESFTPPARSLDDILRSIDSASDQPRPCRICQQDESLVIGIEEQLKLLSHKGIAYNRIGNSDEALRYTRKVVELVESGNLAGDSVSWKPIILVYNRAMQVNESLGDYSLGIRYGEKSRAILDAGSPLGKAGAKTFLLSSLAHHYARLGNLDRARSALNDAEANFSRVAARFNASSPRWADWNGALVYARAHVKQAEGDLLGAEKDFREAMEWFEQTVRGKSFRQNQLLVEAQGLYLVEVLLEQGRTAEAELESRAAIEHALNYFGKYSPGSASSIMGLAKVMMESGRFKDAETLATISLDILEELDATPGSSYFMQALNLQADALLGQNRIAEALASYRKNESGARGHARTLKSFIQVNLNYAIALMHENELDKAETIARAAESYRLDALGEDHPSVKEARALVTLIRARKSGNSDDLRSLQQLIPAIADSLSDRSADQISAAASLQRFRMIVDGYLDLAAETLGNDPSILEPMFQVAQLGRSQSVQKALSASAVRRHISDPELAELVRQEQDLAFKIDSAYQAALRHDPQDADGGSGSQPGVQDLSRALDSIREEIRDEFPEYETLLHPRPASFTEIREILRPHESLISFYFSETRGYLWVIPARGQATLHRIALNRHEVGEMVSTLRQAFNSNARTVAELPAFDLPLANRLYRQLLQPAQQAWQNARALIVVPDGALSSLPLGTLVKQLPADTRDRSLRFDHYRRVDWLASNHSLSYVPTERALLSLRQLPPGSKDRLLFAGFGNPLFGDTPRSNPQVRLRSQAFTVRGLRKSKKGQLDNPAISSTTLDNLLPLPETETELTQVALTLGADVQQSVYVGNRATEEQVKGIPLDNRKIVMFATHALIPGDLDGLEQPALALSSPARSATRGDGLLTMSEILDLKLDADWVVLSACNTGAGSGRGADAVSGLGMAFFYAGSRALLVSHWPVETRSARALTTSVFRLLSDNNLSRDEAINATQRMFRNEMEYADPASGQALFSYAHPLFWAPFTLIGSGV